jgi:hypothetical protein
MKTTQILTGHNGKVCASIGGRFFRTKPWGLTPNPHAAHFWRNEAAMRRAERRAAEPDASIPTQLLWVAGAAVWCAVVAILTIPAWRVAVWEAVTR